MLHRAYIAKADKEVHAGFLAVSGEEMEIEGSPIIQYIALCVILLVFCGVVAALVFLIAYFDV